MQARMSRNPAMIVPNAMPALLALGAAIKTGIVSPTTLALVHLRASQINGCSVCVDMHAREFRKLDDSDERLFATAAWRDTPYFTEAERAALTLAEEMTRCSDRADAVPDSVWEEVTRYYDEPQRATLVLSIATVNLWNRLNISTRQIAGSGKP